MTGVVAATGWSDAEAERFRKSLTRHTLTYVRHLFLTAAWPHLSDLSAAAGQMIWDEIKGVGDLRVYRGARRKLCPDRVRVGVDERV